MPYPMSPINICLLSQFQPYTDKYGMTTNNSLGFSTGNGNLFTAHYAYGLVATNQITNEENKRILNVYRNNFSQSGLLCRSPKFPNDREAQDDIYGLMGAEALLSPNDRSMTRSIYEYGKISANGVDSTEPYQGAQTRAFWAIKVITLGRCRWVWNNIEPGRFSEASWLGRFPAFLAVMQMSLKERINPFFWTWWAATCLYSAWFGDADGNNGDCLILHGTLSAQGYGTITDWICNQVHKGIKRKYGSVGELMSTYFQNPKHPLVELLSKVDSI